MRKITPTLFLALLILGALTATGQNSTYFVQYHHGNGLTFHATSPLTDQTIRMVMFRQNGEPMFDGEDGVLPPLLKNLTRIQGLESLYLKKYELSVFKRPNASWSTIGPQVKSAMTRFSGAMTQVEPRPNEVPCQQQKPALKTLGMARYIMVCPPNHDMVILYFDTIMAPADLDMFDWAIGQDKNSALVTKLAQVDGVQEVFAQNNNVSVSKGKGFLWAETLPKVLAVLLEQIRQIKPSQEVRINLPKYDDEIVQTEVINVPGIGATYHFSSPYLPTTFR